MTRDRSRDRDFDSVQHRSCGGTVAWRAQGLICTACGHHLVDVRDVKCVQPWQRRATAATRLVDVIPERR